MDRPRSDFVGKRNELPVPGVRDDPYATSKVVRAMPRSNKDEARKPCAENGDSDIELEGVDLNDDVPVEEEEEEVASALGTNAKGGKSSNNDDDDEEEEDAVEDEREHEDHDEYEEARKERMELMASEAKQVAAAPGASHNKASVEEQLQYLLGQSEVFAHFLAGTWFYTLCFVVDDPCPVTKSNTISSRNHGR